MNPNHEALPHVTTQNEQELAEPHRLQVKVVQDVESSKVQVVKLSPIINSNLGSFALELCC